MVEWLVIADEIVDINTIADTDEIDTIADTDEIAVIPDITRTTVAVIRPVGPAVVMRIGRCRRLVSVERWRLAEFVERWERRFWFFSVYFYFFNQVQGVDKFGEDVFRYGVRGVLVRLADFPHAIEKAVDEELDDHEDQKEQCGQYEYRAGIKYHVVFHFRFGSGVSHCPLNHEPHHLTSLARGRPSRRDVHGL